MARLKEVYKKEIVPALIKQFGYTSVMQVPRLEKIVLNMGVGEAIGDKKLLENAAGDMQKISGQKPVITKAKKAIAGFKIREGYPIGCMVTLRQERQVVALPFRKTGAAQHAAVRIPAVQPRGVGLPARKLGDEQRRQLAERQPAGQ